VQNWFAAKPLAELVVAMGEMVQYKHYHAKWVSPFPLDRAAAEWVLNVAEPRGILGPDKPLDDQPLLKTQRMRSQPTRATAGQQAQRRIRLGRAQRASAESTVMAEGMAASPSWCSQQLQPVARAIKFGKQQTSPPGDTKKLVNPIDNKPSGQLSAYAIEISKDGQFQRVEQIAKQQLSIGRGAIGRPVDLALEGDLTMSRLHMILERDDAGSFWVTVKGQNPVLVNGRIIPRERSIGVDVGQIIEICSYSIKIR
jgi:hypothetical protein